MVGIIEDYREHYIRSQLETQRRMRYLTEVVQYSLDPFEPGKVTVHVKESLNREVEMRVEFENFPSLDFSPSINLAKARAYESDAGIVIRLAEIVHEHLSNIPRLEPESNIILGEN